MQGEGCRGLWHFNQSLNQWTWAAARCIGRAFGAIYIYISSKPSTGPYFCTQYNGTTKCQPCIGPNVKQTKEQILVLNANSEKGWEIYDHCTGAHIFFRGLGFNHGRRADILFQTFSISFEGTNLAWLRRWRDLSSTKLSWYPISRLVSWVESWSGGVTCMCYQLAEVTVDRNSHQIPVCVSFCFGRHCSACETVPVWYDWGCLSLARPTLNESFPTHGSVLE